MCCPRSHETVGSAACRTKDEKKSCYQLACFVSCCRSGNTLPFVLEILVFFFLCSFSPSSSVCFSLLVMSLFVASSLSPSTSLSLAVYFSHRLGLSLSSLTVTPSLTHTTFLLFLDLLAGVGMRGITGCTKRPFSTHEPTIADRLRCSRARRAVRAGLDSQCVTRRDVFNSSLPPLKTTKAGTSTPAAVTPAGMASATIPTRCSHSLASLHWYW